MALPLGLGVGKKWGYQIQKFKNFLCYITLTIGTSGRHSSQSPFRRLAGMTIVDRSFHYSSSSPSQPFLIEGVLGSKNLFGES